MFYLAPSTEHEITRQSLTVRFAVARIAAHGRFCHSSSPVPSLPTRNLYWKWTCVYISGDSLPFTVGCKFSLGTLLGFVTMPCRHS